MFTKKYSGMKSITKKKISHRLLSKCTLIHYEKTSFSQIKKTTEYDLL